MKRGITFLLVILLSVNPATAAIGLSSKLLNPGDKLVVSLDPGRNGIYREIYIYKEDKLVDSIVLDCYKVCYDRLDVSYDIPSDWHGSYTLYVFDYGKDDYEKVEFSVSDVGSKKRVSGEKRDRRQLRQEDERRYKGFILEFKEPSLVSYKKQINNEIGARKNELEALVGERDKTGLINRYVKDLQIYNIRRKIRDEELNLPGNIKRQKDKLARQHDAIEQDLEDKIGNINVLYGYTATINAMALDINELAARRIANESYVKRVYPNMAVHATLNESVVQINADDVWLVTDSYGRTVTGKNVSIAIIDTGVDYTHPDFGNCTRRVEINGSIEPYVAESIHPYQNSTFTQWNVTRPGYGSITLHFARIDVEQGWDYVYVTDPSDNIIDAFTGNLSDVWTKSIPGDTARIYLSADNIISGWGFLMDSVLNGTINTHIENCPRYVDGYDFVNLDKDPMDDHGHGTHVAGIAAANGSLKGVAPEANLAIYKVLDSFGSGWEADIIAGIERATDVNGDGNFSDHIDVISMSLGGSGDPDDPMSVAVDNAVDAGVVVVVAAGNDGPYSSSIKSPGLARKALTVGAVHKTSNPARKRQTSLDIIDDDYLPLVNALEYSALTPGNGLVRQVRYAGLGYPENFTGSYNGKIALIERGKLLFYEKVRNAYDINASGVIIYNNEYGSFYGTLLNQSAIPAVSVSRDDGRYLLNLTQYRDVYVNMTISQQLEFLAEFSSRGPAYIYNKPDILAPGVLICSSQWMNAFSDYGASQCIDDQHVAISGTSMATPHVAGAVALLLQKNPELNPMEVKAILEKTAVDMGYTRNEQGAGLIDVLAAIQYNGKLPVAYISDIEGVVYL